jgi:hypothetical protein
MKLERRKLKHQLEGQMEIGSRNGIIGKLKGIINKNESMYNE